MKRCLLNAYGSASGLLPADACGGPCSDRDRAGDAGRRGNHSSCKARPRSTGGSWSRTRRRSRRIPSMNITVIPNRTMLGIIALLEGRAHMAMISASLNSEVEQIKKVDAGSRLRSPEGASHCQHANCDCRSIRQIRSARLRSIRSRSPDSARSRTGPNSAARISRSGSCWSAAAAA